MILKASQRGNGRELANHLMNTKDNERVEVHAINGFMGENIHEAFAEIEAISRGTKCQQPFFSVSLNPPSEQSATIADFENAVTRIAEKNNLSSQPHVIVFHEKEGRRHAHCVWSRIDADEMKAINLPYYKNRLQEISKDIYLEKGWDLPKGFIDREMRNPLNFTLAQWQQAKRSGNDPRVIKQALKQCWEQSDSKHAFSKALEEKGFYLAKGDRRGFVAVDWRGEVYSLSRWSGVKSKELKAKLGKAEQQKTVDQVKANLDQQMAQRLKSLLRDNQQRQERRLSPLLAQKQRLRERHDKERQMLKDKQAQRQKQELQERQARLNSGLRGLWDRVTGKQAQIQKQNELEMYHSIKQDQQQRDDLIHQQLQQRQHLQKKFDALKEQHHKENEQVKKGVLSKQPPERMQALEQSIQHKQTCNHGMEM